VDSSRRDARLEAHLQPVWNVFGDFLVIFPKWYGATVLIVRQSFELRAPADQAVAESADRGTG
jgi:hypothetical protein